MKVRCGSYNVFYAFLLFAFMFVGCATVKHTALNQNVKSIDISQESIAIFTVKVANKYKPRYQPKIIQCIVKNNDTGKGEKYLFIVDGEYKGIENEYNEHLISFQLPPGRYKLEEFVARWKNVHVTGFFTIPIYSVFEIEANEIIYLGHIEAHVVEKTNDDQLPAGPPLPLIVQLGVGASGGTFVIEINDLFKNDIELFKNQYHYLSDYNIENRTLPPWKKRSKEDMQ